jgi:uncharacterized phage protein (TIGR02220 family)
MKIRPKNWLAFQHYKDVHYANGARPAWIKLHHKILDDYEFQSMPVAARALAPMLWLIASEDRDGTIDAEPEKLAFRLRWTGSDISDALSPLIGKGFFEVVQFPPTDSRPSLDKLYSESRTEEKRGEEKREETSLVPLTRDGAQSKRKAQIKTEALQYLEFLNAKAGKHFRPVPSNLRFIEARLSEGVPLQDLKTLTVRKCREWLGTDQEKYLRPETLCNATKCHSYLGEIPPEDQTCNVPDATEPSSSQLSPAHAAGRPPTTLPPRPSSPTAGAAVGLPESSNATIPEPSATGPKAMAHFIAGITSSAAIPSPDSGLSKSPETGSGEPPSPSGLSLH